MPHAPRLPQLLYFCDETGTSGDTHFAVGGLALQAERANEIRRDLLAIKADANLTREVKWSNVRARHDDVHKAFADYLSSLIDNNYAHLHIRFAQMAEYDHNLSGARRKVDTISKAYFQLLLHRPGQFYRSKADVFVYPDKGECTEVLPSYLDRLNANATDVYGRAEGSFRLIEPRDSHADPIFQLLDVTIGAACAIRNGRELGKPKTDLAEHIRPKLPDLNGNCPVHSRRTSIWNVRPSIATGQRPRR